MLYASPNMPEKMLKFVKLGQQNPPKREILEREEDFNEIYKEFINEKAKEQKKHTQGSRHACTHWAFSVQPTHK